MSVDTIADLERLGITVRTRAPEQHARIIERRGALLRHAMHCSEEQLQKEGMTATSPQILSECIFAGHSLISHGGVTPYDSRFGPQPRMLPDIHAPPDGEGGQYIRYLNRIREVAL